MYLEFSLLAFISVYSCHCFKCIFFSSVKVKSKQNFFVFKRHLKIGLIESKEGKDWQMTMLYFFHHFYMLWQVS